MLARICENKKYGNGCILDIIIVIPIKDIFFNIDIIVINLLYRFV